MSLRQVEGMFREGDKVEWNSQGGAAVGTVEEMHQGGRQHLSTPPRTSRKASGAVKERADRGAQAGRLAATFILTPAWQRRCHESKRICGRSAADAGGASTA